MVEEHAQRVAEADVEAGIVPIKPENLARYPKDWPAIRMRILERARHCCEGSPAFPDCRVRNLAWGFWTGAQFNQVNKQQVIDMVRVGREWVKPPIWIGDDKIIEIVLTIAHLDHTPEHCEPENLRAWCQRCHLNYDARHHAENAYQTRRAGKAVADMFEATA